MKPAGTNAWTMAISEGAVFADTFFNDLNARIEKWSDTRA